MLEGLQDRVQAWEERSVADGLAGIATLADDGFDGAVNAGEVTAILVSGRILYCDGAIETLGGSPLTARVAPDPELALLLAMEATGGDPQAKYYTEDTAIDSIDDRLRSGGFTGYLELEENVLSGSYYRLYYAGTARSLAFVGTDDRVLTGEEAFDRTLDEVGIYEVVPVDLAVTEPPDPPGGGSGGDETEAGRGMAHESGDNTEPRGRASNATDSDIGTSTGAADDSGIDTGAPSGPSTESVETAPRTDETTAQAVDDTIERTTEDGGDRGKTSETAPDAESDSTLQTTQTNTAQTAPDTTTESEYDTETATAADGQTESESGGSVHTAESSPDTGSEPSVDNGGESAAPDGAPSAGETSGHLGAATVPDEQTQDTETAEDGSALGETSAGAVTPRDPESGDAAGKAAEEDQLQALVERVDRLERTVQSLQADAETDVPSTKSTGTGDTDSTSQHAALEATDCLVRYETRAGGTVESVLDGEASAEDLRENLRVETNTTVDATIVEGEPFEEFFAATLERRVVGWLLCELPTEIVATDSRSDLKDLVEALPSIDRIGFQETVDPDAFTDETLEEETPSAVDFDLVAWDSDGHPRVVADLNHSVDPVGEAPVSSLITRAKTVAAHTDLASALFATDGYVEADARRAVEATTGGGLLARDSRRSYVKMTRNRGFHCCLAEAYDDAIHLTVPEL